MTNASNPPRAYAAAHFAFELDGTQKLGMFRSAEGGGIKSDVMTYQNGGTYERWRQLGKPKFEDIKLQVGMAMSEPFYTWIAEFFEGVANRKNGAIIAADFYYNERARREFSEAMIKELQFPALKADDKNSAYMTVSLAVEDILYKKGDEGKKISQDAAESAQKNWKVCNFNFSLDGFACCSRVTKVESFTIKQNILEYNCGGRRSAAKTPSPIDFPQLSFSLPEVDAQPLFDHFRKRGVKGEVPGRLHGQIDTYDNEKESAFTLEFFGADILNIQPDKSDASSEEIKQCKVDLYIEKMTFKYKPSANPSTGQ